MTLSMYSALQFERTLIIAEEDSYVSYLEGCTAPAYDTNQVREPSHCTSYKWGGIVRMTMKIGRDYFTSWYRVEGATAPSWYRM